MNSKPHGKCQFALKLIQLSTISNLFPLEVVQKWQFCQLSALQENSIMGKKNDSLNMKSKIITGTRLSSSYLSFSAIDLVLF